jgi:hypothetical protein
MRAIRIAAVVLTMFGTRLAAQAMTLPAGPTTAVLVNLTIKPEVQRPDFMKVAPEEVRMTVQAHLDGKILQWYGRSDGRGVMFIVNASTVEEARAVMEQLPLFKAKLVDYQYTALGPLMPLRVLLAPPPVPKP